MVPDSTFVRPAMPCGGARAGKDCICFLRTKGEKVTFSVRGSAYGEAYLTAPDRIEAIWFSAKLLGTIPGLGRVLFTTRPEMPSKVTISRTGKGISAAILAVAWFFNNLLKNSKWFRAVYRGKAVNSMINATFFPATASQDMYYDVQLLDNMGRETTRLRSELPAIFEAEIQSIPPLGTVFRTTKDVDYFNTTSGVPTFSMLTGSPGQVTETPGIDLDLRVDALDLEKGTFNGSVAVKVAAKQPARLCWFVTPVLGANLDSPMQAIDVQAEPSIQIPLVATFEDSSKRSGVVIQCFSSSDPPMEKHLVVVFSDL